MAEAPSIISTVRVVAVWSTVAVAFAALVASGRLLTPPTTQPPPPEAAWVRLLPAVNDCDPHGPLCTPEALDRWQHLADVLRPHNRFWAEYADFRLRQDRAHADTQEFATHDAVERHYQQVLIAAYRALHDGHSPEPAVASTAAVLMPR